MCRAHHVVYGLLTRISTAVIVGALLLLVAPPARGQSAGSSRSGPVVVVAGAALELDGDSSLHRYSAKANGLEAGVGIDAARVAATAQPLDAEALIRGHFIKSFQVTVPVDRLSSGKGGLDDKMHKALKGKHYREIQFRMDSYDVLAPSGAGAVLTVMLHGRLSVAGVERRIDVGAAGVRVRDGIRFSGSRDLLMTDYQIKPPTFMLGAIKAANIVTVKFDMTLQSKAKP
jgi:polyisoprenoid-binding protein YceI